MMGDTATATHMGTPRVQRREGISIEEATSMDLKRISRHLLQGTVSLLALCALIYGEAKADGLGPAPEGSFTIAVIPDTQGYRGSRTKAQPESTDPVTNPVFEAHTTWIEKNIDSQRIVFVSHTGDIVDKNVPDQWAVALACMNRLHGRVPYAISVGNHDMTGSGDSSLFQGLFPASRYTDLPWYGGSFKAAPERPKVSGNNANSYQLISAEGVGLVILHLECNAPADVLQWADSILRKHSDRLGIVATHMDLGPLQRPKTNKGYQDDPKGRMQWKKCHGARGMSPQQMWDTCYRKHPNLAILLSGDQSRTTAMYFPLTGDHGNTVHALLSDYTSSGPMRLYRFLPDEDTVQVITYNTSQEGLVKSTAYVPDPAAHQFSIKIPIGTYRKAADYYVSPQGKDSAAGSKAAPWQSLAKACETAAPGDTVILREGIYRETLRPQRSGEKGRPIRFQSAAGERAVISGAELLTGKWEKHRDNIYKLRTDLLSKQLFVDGEMMVEARWPNSPYDNLMEYNRAVAEEGTGYEVLADSHLPAGDWTGGVVLMWPGQWWVSNTRRIASYEAGKALRFDRTMEPKRKDEYHANDPYQPRAGNYYVIMGCLAGLDAPGEWFLDRNEGAVYLWLPEGDDPGKHCVEIKQRDCAFDLSKLGYIEIKGIDVLGAGVNMGDAHDSLLEDCQLRYVEHYRDCEREKLPGIQNFVSGKNNTWRRCLVAYAATTLLNLRGENNRLDNCVLHDGNYLGTGRGGLDLGNSVAAHVSHCTIFRSGRDLVGHGRSRRLRFEYNDLSAANMLNDDAAAIYCWGTDGERGVIAYNWIHDNIRSRGVYLDNFSTNFVVHHNVIWGCAGNAVRMNCDAVNHQVYNNTMMQVDEPFGTYTYAGYEPTMKGTKVINNLVNVSMDPKDPRQFVQGELGPELHHNGSGAVDRDGYPVAGSKAIDAGVAIPGITDGFKGKAPDLGAYEFGGPHWTAGADWKDPEAIFVSNKNLEYQPQPPVTADTMIKRGLILWLDAMDSASLDLQPDGSVIAWRDKSPAAHVARPKTPDIALKRVNDGLSGKPVVRGNGREKLYISGMPQRGPGGVTALVVSQSQVTSGPTWGRIIQCFTGEGKSWELPNWEIMHPGGKAPQAYDARIYLYTRRFDASLADITLLATAADVAEVLVFDRALRFDEEEALRNYLKSKWGLK